MTKIYVSCPVSISDRVLHELITKLTDRYSFCNITYWDRRQYYSNERYIGAADVVAVVLPEVKFKCDVDSLPSGVAREISMARAQGKMILIVFKTANGDVYLYESAFQFGLIAGVSGTTGDVSNYLKSFESVPVEVKPIPVTVPAPVESLKFDKRLLLFL